MTPKERFAAAEARYKAKNTATTIFCDTPELAAEHGVRLGDHVRIRNIPEFVVGNAQDGLDDYMYATWLRCGGWKDGA